MSNKHGQYYACGDLFKALGKFNGLNKDKLGMFREWRKVLTGW